MSYEEVSLRFRAATKGQHGQGASPAEIRHAEHRLGTTLPRGYKSFVAEFGWGTFAQWELYGLGADVPPQLDLVRVTLEERTEFHPLNPPQLIPILNDGGGNLHCLDTSRLVSGECPVVVWDHELQADQIPLEEASCFLSWLSQRLSLAEEML